MGGCCCAAAALSGCLLGLDISDHHPTLPGVDLGSVAAHLILSISDRVEHLSFQHGFILGVTYQRSRFSREGTVPAFIKVTVTIQVRAVADTTVDQVQALGFYGVHRGQRILYLFGSSIVGCIAAILIFWQQERKKLAFLDGARHRCIAEVNAFLKPLSVWLFRYELGLYGT